MSIEFKSYSKLDVWNRLYCPVCGGNHFICLDYSSIWCKECNVEIKIRATSGDPGYVADCYTKSCYNIIKQDGYVYNYADMAEERIPGGHAYYIDKEGENPSGWICINNINCKISKEITLKKELYINPQKILVQ